MHLDNGAPWMYDSELGTWWTTQSVVLQLTDGPGTEVGGALIPDLWNQQKGYPPTNLKKLLLAEEKGTATLERRLVRAGTMITFPSGFVFFFYFFRLSQVGI